MPGTRAAIVLRVRVAKARRARARVAEGEFAARTAKSVFMARGGVLER